MPALLQWAGLLVIAVGAALLWGDGVGLVVFGAGMVAFGVAMERERSDDGAS